MAHKLLSTGLATLDNELEGGLHQGSLVYMTADSMAMAEIFLYQFLQQRPTYYVNTERRPEFIVNNLKQFGFKTTDIIFINVHGKSYEKEEKLLDYGGELRNYRILNYLIQQLEAIEAKDVNLIIDTITFFLYLDVKRDMIRKLIDMIYNTTKRIGGLGFLYGLKSETRLAIENEVINICDVVFDISMIKKSDKTITELVIPKARDRPIHGNILKFKIEGGIIMDTSREIV